VEALVAAQPVQLWVAAMTKATPRSSERAVKSPTPVDHHVAARAERLRIHRGITQLELSFKLNVCDQQVYKYLTGRDRMTAGRLWELAQALGVPIQYFFEGL
jgi:hypothetical protein